VSVCHFYDFWLTGLPHRQLPADGKPASSEGDSGVIYEDTKTTSTHYTVAANEDSAPEEVPLVSVASIGGGSIAPPTPAPATASDDELDALLGLAPAPSAVFLPPVAAVAAAVGSDDLDLLLDTGPLTVPALVPPVAAAIGANNDDDSWLDDILGE
jgi:hypothetical protein